MNSDSDPGFPWADLAITSTGDVGEIRRAYARRLKTVDAAADPTAFQVLRRAYEAALALAAGEGKAPAPVPLQPEPLATRDPSSAQKEPLRALDPVIAEVVALGRRGKIPGAMAAIDRFIHGDTLSLEHTAMLEARLCAVVMDDPDMPPALLAALGKRFRWNEVGSALEQWRPALYERFLYRMGLAYAWLHRAKMVAQVDDAAGGSARLVLQRYSRRLWWTGLGRFDRAALDDLVLDARRFGPLLGDTIDQRMVDHLGRAVHTNHREYLEWRVRRAMMLAPVILGLLGGAIGSLYYFGIADYLLGNTAQPGAKAMLSDYPQYWTNFHLDRGDDKLIVSFMYLLANRSALAEIRYGVNKEVPDKTFDFPPDDSPTLSPLPPDIRTFLEMPKSTRFLTIQLRFKDGIMSPLRRYDVPADPTK